MQVLIPSASISFSSYWHPDPSNGLPKEEIGTLRSLVSNFPPNIFKLHLFYAKAWSDGFMEFVFVELEGFAFLAVKPPMILQFLSLLNRMNDCKGCCILPLLAEIVIEPLYLEYNEEDSTNGRQNCLSYSSIISPS